MAKKRRDINSLTDAEIATYIHAINILRQRSQQNPDDESGYDFQAALHNDVFVGPCEHGNDIFLPWHRAHLHYFEKLLQESDPPRTSNVTIPYWDWLHNANHQGAKFPAVFSIAGLMSGGRNLNNAKLPPDTLEIVVGERDWREFGGYPEDESAGDRPEGNYGRLEIGPHNWMHGEFIGGRMGDPASAAEDPIYFSFHAFIDLLWGEWQRRNNMPGPTSPDAELRGFTTKPLHMVRDFQSTLQLDFEYEYTDSLQQAFQTVIDEPVLGTFIGAEKLQPLFGDSLSSQLQKAANAQFALPAVPNQVAVVQLRNLKIPHTGNYTLWALLHPRSVPFVSTEEFKHQYGVGYLSLWKTHSQHHDAGSHHTNPHGHHHGIPKQHHPSSCIVRFKLQKVLDRVGPDATNDLVFTLYYVPAPLADGTPQPGSQVVKEVELDDLLLESYTS